MLSPWPVSGSYQLGATAHKTSAVAWTNWARMRKEDEHDDHGRTHPPPLQKSSCDWTPVMYNSAASLTECADARHRQTTISRP